MSFRQEKLVYDEIEINFLHLAKMCLKKVKFIVVIGLIIGIAFSTFMYFKDAKVADSMNVSTESIELTEKQQENIKKYYFLETNQENMKNYGEKAPIMNINYNDVYQIDLQYYVSAQEGVQEDISVALSNYIKSQAFIEKVCEKIDALDSRYARELFSIADEQESAIISICVFAASEADAQSYVEIVKEVVKLKSQEYSSLIGTHELQLVQEDITVGYLSDVYEVQNMYYTNYNNAKNTLINHSATLSDIEWSVINAGGEETTIESSKFNVKFMILGFFAGLLLGIALVVLITLFDGKIQSHRELKKRFDIVDFGYGSKDIIESELSSIVLKINKVLEAKGGNEVQIVSSIREDVEEFTESLRVLLGKENIKCYCLENVIDSTNNPVILMEKVGCSKVKAVYEEVDLCKEIGVEVLGYISISE